MLATLRIPLRAVSQRGICTSFINRLKEIVIQDKGNVTIVEGKNIASPREPYLLPKKEGDAVCPLCRLNLDLKHTDVLILRQFVKSDGEMLSRNVTGLCYKQHKYVSRLVEMAKRAGIFEPPGFIREEVPSGEKWRKKFSYDKFNTYFDESTINLRK